MKGKSVPHPDYESLRDIFGSVAAWITRYRHARDQFSNCSADDVAAMAHELNISPGELIRLTQKGPDAANLLYKLLVGLGFDPKALSQADPVIMRDLQRLCITCGHKRRCELDVANNVITQNFHEYCPNAYTLDALVKAKQ